MLPDAEPARSRSGLDGQGHLAGDVLVRLVPAGDEPVRYERRHQQRESRHDQGEPEPAQERIAERPADRRRLVRVEAQGADVELTVAGGGGDRARLLPGESPRPARLGARTLSSRVNRIVPSSAMPNTPPTSRLVFVIAEPSPARCGPTEFITAAVMGAIVDAMPWPMIANSTPITQYGVSGVRRESAIRPLPARISP